MDDFALDVGMEYKLANDQLLKRIYTSQFPQLEKRSNWSAPLILVSNVYYTAAYFDRLVDLFIFFLTENQKHANNDEHKLDLLEYG